MAKKIKTTKEPWQMTAAESRQHWDDIMDARAHILRQEAKASPLARGVPGATQIINPNAVYGITKAPESLLKQAYEYWEKGIKDDIGLAQIDIQHIAAILQADAEGKQVPAKVLQDYPGIKQLMRAKAAAKPQTALERVAAHRARMRKKYGVLFGMRIKLIDGTFQLMDVNDLGVPYWAKVTRGKPQKKLVTIGLRSQEWLEEELARRKRIKQQKPLPKDAEVVKNITANEKEFLCYARKKRMYCRRAL